MEEKLKALQERNNNLTREECDALLKRLKEERLDPIIALLYTEGGSKVSFADIVSGYSAIEEDFKNQSRGAKDVCAQVFYEFHPVSLLTWVGSEVNFWDPKWKCHWWLIGFCEQSNICIHKIPFFEDCLAKYTS